jgi:hypothetical protein
MPSGPQGLLKASVLDVGRLAHVAAGVDLVVHGDEHALAGGVLAAGHGHGVVEVEHAVGRHGGARAHGAHHHHRLAGLEHQVQEEGGLFQGVGAVGDDDAVHVSLAGQGGDALAQGDQVFVGEALGGDLEDLVAAHVGQVLELGHAGDELVHRHLGGLVGGAVGHAGARAGNGAAGGQDDHAGLVGGVGRQAAGEARGEQTGEGDGAEAEEGHDRIPCWVGGGGDQKLWRMPRATELMSSPAGEPRKL